MKTKEQIKKYLLKNGHSPKAMDKICGFLVGAGIKDSDEPVKFAKGTGTFDDFMDWYNCDEDACFNCPLYGVLEYLCERMNETNDKELIDRLQDYTSFLISSFGVGVEENDGEMMAIFPCAHCRKK